MAQSTNTPDGLSSEDHTIDAGDEGEAGKELSDTGTPSTRRRWVLTQEAFDKLLVSLDPDRESAGKKYIEVRSNLLRFFEWRGCPFPEDHADETINRVAKRIAEGEEVRNPSSYFLGVARMLLLEIYKERAKERQAMGELANSQSELDAPEALEPRVDCLRHCLDGLPQDNRDLILHYYQGEKGAKIKSRKKLSEQLEVQLGTLRMRALRLRERLQQCVEDCVKDL